MILLCPHDIDRLLFSGGKIINPSGGGLSVLIFGDFVPNWSFVDRRAFPALITHQNIVVECNTLYNKTLYNKTLYPLQYIVPQWYLFIQLSKAPKPVVDRPTQLICISDIYLIQCIITCITCQQTTTKDIAGRSATKPGHYWAAQLSQIIIPVLSVNKQTSVISKLKAVLSENQQTSVIGKLKAWFS